MTPVHLSRGMDYLGNLGAKLRDLQGYRTLIHELIQNADDASGTTMAFDVQNEALVVDNNGIFSDCGRSDQRECPWLSDDTHNFRCDFHRFRWIASGDKRSQAGTTGAFGIGFIAVYQITDLPELISAGRHWKLNEISPEDERIEVCSGCPVCQDPRLPATRFILPWATNPNSPLRNALGAEAVTQDSKRLLIEELQQSIPVAMLFLKTIRHIEIREHGKLIRAYDMLAGDASLILSDGDSSRDRIWYIVRGDFAKAAARLRGEHGSRIEDKRSSNITLAIPSTHLDTGLLCACLPTEQSEGLPFHVNADFFTSNDRKRVILEQDYQSEWNREALRASARAIGNAVPQLPVLLGAVRFWDLISSLKHISDKVEQRHGELTLAEFWKQVEPKLACSLTIQTTTNKWEQPADTCLLLQPDEVKAINVLENIGIKVVREDLRPFQSLLRSGAVGVPILNVDKICSALTSLGLDQRIDATALPEAIQAKQHLNILWGELALLLDRQQRTPEARKKDEDRLQAVALAPGRDQALWPFQAIYSADDQTVELFNIINPEIPFIASDEIFRPLDHLCPRFDATAAVERLSKITVGELERLWKLQRLPLKRLFEWFENHRQSIISDPVLKGKLSALTLFPSKDTLRPIKRLSLPGDFKDPLDLAELIDLDALGGRREFLKDLAIKELDFLTYATVHLPQAFRDNDVPASKRREAILLLAGRLGELTDHQEAHDGLAAIEIVECMDGVFRQARQCHFDSDTVRGCLGDAAHLVTLPEEHKSSVDNIYQWLGVAREPRWRDIADRIRAISIKPYSLASVQQIQQIFAHIGGRISDCTDIPDLSALRELRWLPARGKTDRWYSPHELYASYQDYLFESQVLFLDVPRSIQNTNGPLLEFLGINLTPTISLVIEHLLHCVKRQTPINTEVYRFLNDKCEEPEIARLEGLPCLWLDDRYYSAKQVFWGEHPFGSYRRRLKDELRIYGKLLERLDVRETPTWEDALSVLREISDEFGSSNQPLNDKTQAVLMDSWRLIGQAIDDKSEIMEVVSSLGSIKCVPDVRRVLVQPEWMFFENRAGLAAKFQGFLVNNVIIRPIGSAGYAMEKAGVRPLGSAVEIGLLECANPTDAPDITQRILERLNQIGRVLESQGLGRDAEAALRRLKETVFKSVESLLISYALCAFNRKLESLPEQVPALYQPNQGHLLFVRRAGEVSWPAVARELAIALIPQEDPGRIAAGLKEVLAAKSLKDAETTLDELGFTRLDTTVRQQAETGPSAGILGTGQPPEISTLSTGGQQQLTPAEAIEAMLGAGAHGPTPMPQGAVVPEEPIGPGPKPPTRRTSKLRSYVVEGDSDLSEKQDPEIIIRRTAVEEAGVTKVVAYEQSEGRFPKVMPPKHPGYDIESMDKAGNVVRYVEVKAVSGEWGLDGVEVTHTQFDTARKYADMYWLYIVELANQNNAIIHRIQNPACRVMRYMFDDGWRGAAEDNNSQK